MKNRFFGARDAILPLILTGDMSPLTNTTMDYSAWGERELIEELERRDAEAMKRLEPIRAALVERYPGLQGKLGITWRGVYRHNPDTGFNELVDKEGECTGESPY